MDDLFAVTSCTNGAISHDGYWDNYYLREVDTCFDTSDCFCPVSK